MEPEVKKIVAKSRSITPGLDNRSAAVVSHPFSDTGCLVESFNAVGKRRALEGTMTAIASVDSQIRSKD